MADRYWIGASGANWSTASNWSLTDGGGSVGAIPTSSDAVFFTSTTNTSCVLDTAVAKVCASLTIGSGYTGTLTFNVNLSVSGSITFTGTGFSFSGAGYLRMIAAGTWTTNGKTIGVAVEIGGTTTFTCTLADALTISGATSPNLLLSNTTSTIFSGAFDINAQFGVTISGTQTITLSGNLFNNGSTAMIIADANTINGFTLGTRSLTVTGALSGTTVVYFLATGTWSGAAACNCSVTINSSGNGDPLGHGPVRRLGHADPDLLQRDHRGDQHPGALDRLVLHHRRRDVHRDHAPDDGGPDPDPQHDGARVHDRDVPQRRGHPRRHGRPHRWDMAEHHHRHERADVHPHPGQHLPLHG